jgi:hypothetical protein
MEMGRSPKQATAKINWDTWGQCPAGPLFVACGAPAAGKMNGNLPCDASAPRQFVTLRRARLLTTARSMDNFGLRTAIALAGLTIVLLVLLLLH